MDNLDPESHLDRVNNLFSDALNRPEDERKEYVARRAGSDQRLRDSVLRMLDYYSKVDSFLSDPLTRLGGPGYEIRTGEVLNQRFRVTAAIGRGGMGEVYRADDLQMQDVVALKMIRADWRGRKEILDRFHSEIRLTRRIAHPNICPVYDSHHSVLESGAPLDFFTMKYLDGDTLAHRMAGKTLPVEEILRLVRGIASGLDAAHRERVIHRDLKPANVILVQAPEQPDFPVITDFGLASVDAPPTEETSLTQIAGSPIYMAPEQLSGDPLSPATDTYALASIVFEMAAGRPPFSKHVLRRLVEDAPLLSTLTENYPPHWNRILANALSRNVLKRPKSAGALVAMLERAPGWRPTLTFPPIYKPTRRTAILTGFSALGMSAFLLFRRYTGRSNPILPDAPTLMLTNFTHSSDTRDQNLAHVVDTLLESQLQQSAHVRLISRAQVDETIGRMRAAHAPDIDLSNSRVAREVALRQGASFIAFGTLARTGDEYMLRTHLELLGNSPERARDHWDFDRAFSDEELSSLSASLTRVAYDLRKKMGESQKEWELRSNTPEQLTTASWPALRSFVEANDYWREGKRAQSFSALETAISIDPQFTTARGRLADRQMAIGNDDEALANYEATIQLLDQKNLNDRESFRIRGMFFLDTAQWQKAAQTLERYRQSYPRDALPCFLEAGAVRRLGNHAYSETLLNKAIELEPKSYTYAMWRAIYDLENGNRTKAAAACDAASQLADDAYTCQLRAALAFVPEGAPRVLTNLNRMTTHPDGKASGAQLKACCFSELGHDEEAEKLLLNEITLLTANGAAAQELVDTQLTLIDLRLRQEKRNAALAACEPLLKTKLGIVSSFRLGCMLARAGDLAGARKQRKPVPSWPVYQHWVGRLEGELALAEDNAQAALDAMRSAPGPLVPNVWPEYLVRAALAAGDTQTAAAPLQALVSNPQRYFFQAHLVGPGFMREALHQLLRNPGVAKDPDALANFRTLLQQS